MGDRLYSVRHLSLRCPSETLRLVSWFENGGGEGGRPHGYLSLASVATGHSLVAPGGSGNGKEAGGVGQGGGEDFPHHTHTLAMNRAGRRKWLACGRACIIRIREGAVNTAAHVPV